MPHAKAAFKHIRQTKKRTVRNRQVMNQIRLLIKKSRKAIEARKKEEAAELVKKTIKALDKATQNKVIKKNTVARKKSRLMKRLNRMK